MNARETQSYNLREREEARNELPPVDPWQLLNIYAHMTKYRLKRGETCSSKLA